LFYAVDIQELICIAVPLESESSSACRWTYHLTGVHLRHCCPLYFLPGWFV